MSEKAKTENKVEKEPEFSVLESAEVLQSKLVQSEDFLEKNKKMIYGFGGAIALLIAGVWGYFYFLGIKNEEAQKEMFQAVYYFESDSLKKALNGDGNASGFTQIIEDYGYTKAGNMARFYAGATYMKQGKFNEAVELLSDFSCDDILVQARALALAGDAYLELKNLEDAIKFYKKASEYKANKFFTPRYLLKLALAQELNKDLEGAEKTYAEIEEKYNDSMEAAEAKKFKAKISEMLSNK